jgi:Ran-binding protein 1
LKHKENGKTRLVMRRDKTLKVCANHYGTMQWNLSLG